MYCAVILVCLDGILYPIFSDCHSQFRRKFDIVRAASIPVYRFCLDNLTSDDQPIDETDEAIEIIDVSEYQPRCIPSKQWRDCIKKIYEADPLRCPKCGGEMKIISFITDQQVIRQILKHLGLWTPAPSRDPPGTKSSPKDHALVYEFLDDLSAFNAQADVWPGYDESCITPN